MIRQQTRMVMVAVSVLLAWSAPRGAAAQTIRGSMTGTVSDSTGAMVPGATVTVTEAATGIVTTAVTDQRGGYTLPLLSPGTYQVAVELQGFKKYVRNGIVVEIAQTTRLDIPLQVGTV